jgi:hypothetical protein
MPIALPYRFDTSPIVKLILRGVLGLLTLVIVPGIGYSLLISHDRAAAVHLLITGAIVMYFGRIFIKNLEATSGTITTADVVVEPGSLYGTSLRGPRGRFPIQHFSAVRVQRIPPSGDVQRGAHERVILTGKGGTPDILVARTSHDTGRALGRDLATALGLPYEEEVAPY